MPLDAFCVLKVEPKFIEEMRAGMPCRPHRSQETLLYKRMNDQQSFYFLCMNPIDLFFLILCGIKIVERDINLKKDFLGTPLLPATCKTFKEVVHVTSR